MYKSKLDRALEIAATGHRLQLRKGTGIPYITHPISVMLIAAKVTDDEDTLCACLLHDVLEDGDPKAYGESEMLRDFGPGVTSAVKVVSKNANIRNWRDRNEAYLHRVRDSHDQAAFIVCAADKVHNLKSVLADHAEIGEALWSRFNSGKDAQKWWYRSVLELLKEKLPDNALVAQLESLVRGLEKL